MAYQTLLYADSGLPSSLLENKASIALSINVGLSDEAQGTAGDHPCVPRAHGALNTGTFRSIKRPLQGCMQMRQR